MNEKTVGTSQGSRLRRAFWAAPMAYLAMGLTLACSGGAPDDDSIEDEQSDGIGGNNAVHDDTKGVGTLRSALVGARQCEPCTTKQVCDYELVSCSPPIFVNGREIKCLEEVCRDEIVCPPCSGEADIDLFDGLDLDILDGLGGSAPIDPLPFSF